MNLEIPDEDIDLLATALEHYYSYTVAKNAEDSRYRDLADRILITHFFPRPIPARSPPACRPRNVIKSTRFFPRPIPARSLPPSQFFFCGPGSWEAVELVAWANEAAAINTEAVERRRTGRVLAFASCLLLLTGSAPAQLATTKFGGIQADLLSLGLKNGIVTASVKLTNTNKDQIAYVLAMGSPSGVDDGGVKFIGTGTGGADAVGGVAYCVGPKVNPPEARHCMGSPHVDEYLFPLEQYTEIETDNSVMMQLHLATPGAAGKSDKVSLSLVYTTKAKRSADGKTMTVAVKGTNPFGQTVDGTNFYDKQ